MDTHEEKEEGDDEEEPRGCRSPRIYLVTEIEKDNARGILPHMRSGIPEIHHARKFREWTAVTKNHIEKD